MLALIEVNAVNAALFESLNKNVVHLFTRLQLRRTGRFQCFGKAETSTILSIRTPFHITAYQSSKKTEKKTRYVSML